MRFDEDAVQYIARFDGMDYLSSIGRVNGVDFIRLRSREPLDGFEQARPGLYVRVVTSAQCEAVLKSVRVGIWRGLDSWICTISGDRASLMYLGGDQRRAVEAGFRAEVRGVYTAVASLDEVTAQRRQSTFIVAPH